MQCVAVCCGVLHLKLLPVIALRDNFFAPVRCSVLQCVVVNITTSHRLARWLHCTCLLQYLHPVAVNITTSHRLARQSCCTCVLQCVAVFHSVLQGEIVNITTSCHLARRFRCNCVLQCAAVCYSVLTLKLLLIVALQDDFVALACSHRFRMSVNSTSSAVCCRVLQCVAVFAVCYSVLQCERLHTQRARQCVTCVAVCCSLLQCVAVCCGVLQCVAVWMSAHSTSSAVCYVCCSVLQCAAVFAVCCSMLQFECLHT